MEFLKIRHLKHSGFGDNALHLRVMREFRRSEDHGIYYCKQRGWRTLITGSVLTVYSPALFGFEFSALIKR